MSNLPLTTMALLILLLMTMNMSQLSSARAFVNTTPNQSHNFNQKITFLMRDIFNGTTTSISSSNTNKGLSTTTPSTSTSGTYRLPFSKPLGLFPPNGAVLVPETNLPLSPRTLDLAGIGFSFPAKATLQELELGAVTKIEEDIYQPNLGRDTYGSKLLGKARGIYVASFEDGTSHMMALRVHFGGKNGDDDDRDANGLRFFGVKKSDVSESQGSHIAVIGGVGKFQGANGYATVKRVTARPSGVVGEERGLVNNKLLEFSVYLS